MALSQKEAPATLPRPRTRFFGRTMVKNITSATTDGQHPTGHTAAWLGTLSREMIELQLAIFLVNGPEVFTAWVEPDLFDDDLIAELASLVSSFPRLARDAPVASLARFVQSDEDLVEFIAWLGRTPSHVLHSLRPAATLLAELERLQRARDVDAAGISPPVRPWLVKAS
jgi:hypothetical protein